MSTSSFSITSTPRSLAAVTVRVLGQLDRTGVARLRTELAQWREAGVSELLLDLSGVSGADPGAARALAWARIQLRGRGGNLIVTDASASLRARLETEVAALETIPGAHSDRSADLIYRPETADQPS
jgi:anti-anti-sigma regulatory factor